jgi:hypothetical protein
MMTPVKYHEEEEDVIQSPESSSDEDFKFPEKKQRERAQVPKLRI